MNANEVITNLALERLGHPKGNYQTIHPNDDVNLSQSTNDVYPTAVRLAILCGCGDLDAAIDGLASAFEERASAFAGIVKLGRTQLQDAVPITLGQELTAFAVTLREERLRIVDAAKLLLEINLGGTAVGTGLNASDAYRSRVVSELRAISGHPFVSASDLIEASWDTGAFVAFSSMLKRLAVKLSKIANDLRLLSSGPRGGFGELVLPAMQPGSSIMPGKINPVIPEALNQVCFQVIGNDLTVTMAAEAGQLQLNAFEPVIVANIMQSMNLLTNAIRIFSSRCVSGIQANQEKCLKTVEISTALATALVPHIGYEAAARLAKAALQTGSSISDAAKSLDFDEQNLRDILNLTGMINLPN
jgi:aspartate ammonia-lyase